MFFGIRDPGSEIRDLGSGIRDPGWEKPGSGIQDGKNPDPGSGIRDKHPGSATLLPTMVLAASIFRKLSEYRTMDYQKTTIGLSEYLISDRKVRKIIRPLDIGYQTQTIGLSDIGYKKSY